jgi:hypothetical protein
MTRREKIVLPGSPNFCTRSFDAVPRGSVDPSGKPREATHNRTFGLIFFAVAILINLSAAYPGTPTPDSDDQYKQAVSGPFNDWHPPIMASLWSVLRLVADGSGSLFTIHVFCYWLGFALIAATFCRLGRDRAAWAVIGVGAFPPFVLMNTHILKDVGMAVSFLAAFSICFFYRSCGKNISLLGAAVAAALLLYGILVRVNGIFAAAPLLVYLAYPSLLQRPVYLTLSCIALAATAIPASNAFNHKVLHATATHPENSLIVFDIAGIAFFSNDLSVFWPGSSASTQSVSNCYTPVEWDTLAHRKDCRIWADQYQKRRWVWAILKHPLAYAEPDCSLQFGTVFYCPATSYGYSRAQGLYVATRGQRCDHPTEDN